MAGVSPLVQLTNGYQVAALPSVGIGPIGTWNFGPYDPNNPDAAWWGNPLGNDPTGIKTKVSQGTGGGNSQNFGPNTGKVIANGVSGTTANLLGIDQAQLESTVQGWGLGIGLFLLAIVLIGVGGKVLLEA